jgi:hypothetical protein
VLQSFTDIRSPIKTYGHKGTAKNLATHPQHAIIYTLNQPDRLPLEPEFHKLPLEVKPEDNSQQLDPASRLNFARPTPVEHNLLVKRIGNIVPEHMERLFRFYNEENGTTRLRAAAAVAQQRIELESAVADGDDEDEDSSEEDEQDDEDQDPYDKRPIHVVRRVPRRESQSGPHLLQAPSRPEGSQRPRSKSQSGRHRSNTSRSSPVPRGSQRLASGNPRRLTDGDGLPLQDDSRTQRHVGDHHRRGDRNYYN